MIDYLLRFPDEAAAMDALPVYVLDGIEPGAREWDASCTLAGVEVYRVTGTETVEDGIGGAYEREIREVIPGWYVWIARPARDPALEDDACVLIASADSSAILHTITTPEDLATLTISPMFAGRPYVIGAPVIADG